MKFKIFGKEISVKKEEEKKSVLPENLSERAFADYVKEQMKNTGRTEAQILGEVFKDGWLVWMVEESGGSAQLELSQLFKAGKKPDDKVKEYIRLRENFAPISNCVDYLIDKIIGGGIGVVIDDPSDKNQKEHKEELERLLEDIYQDEYKRGLRTILPILVNEALTTGSAATEITYDGDKTFWDYAEISETAKTVQIKGKPVEIVLYNTKEPKWNTDLKGLDRLKIIDRAYERFVVQRDPKTWEIKYWILDEGKSVQPITLPSGIVVRKLVGKTVAGTYLHPWQVFWLTLKQRGFDVKGESVIKPVYEVSILLEKILKAVGEGIHRAGNKKYFIICTPEGTMVWTPSGYKAIETINVGEKVWDRNSTAEVLQTFKRPYKGDLIVVKPRLLESVSFTPNHPIKVARKRRLRTKEGHEKYLVIFDVLDGYKRADELTINDWLIVPKVKESRDIWIDFPLNQLKNGRFNTLPSQYLSEDLAKIFGWYLAEGNPVFKYGRPYQIVFHLGKKEVVYAKEIVDLIWKTLGLKATISERKTALDITVCSKSFAQFIVDWFGHGAANKHLPATFLYWKPEILKALISRIVAGDGHLGKDNWFKLKLNSKTLQKQLQLALLKIGQRAAISKIKRNPIGYIQGRKINQHDAWLLTWSENNRVIAEDDENYYFRIVKIDRSPFDDYVYNLRTTSGHYYLPFMTHNCGSAERPWSTPHIRNVLQQLKEASKKNWSTIPMPMGFDIKDIGGEVFEADQVVNYFLKVIAGGMKVPAKVLGIEVREQKEYSYTEYRSNLLLAIKHQLFKRHVWCKHGMKRTKQGGKGEEPVYIPNPKIKIEGLFTTPLEELEIYIKMLNPANPITPQLKLEAEKGIAKLMGWDMIDFPTQEEYEKKLREREEQALKFGKSRVIKVPSEKEQGKPEPQTVERQEKRLEGMRKKGETEKGKSKPMGGTREPAEVKIEEIAQPIAQPQKVEVDIRVSGEPIKTEPQKIIVETKTPHLEKLVQELSKKEKKLAEKEDLLKVEIDKQKQKVLEREAEKLELETRKLKADIERIEAEKKKIETETDETKKTHLKKREMMEKIVERE